MAYENYKTNFESGKGKNSPVPDIVKKRFNWGVFCLPIFWSFGNKSYIPLTVMGIMIVINFMPIIGTIINLILGLPINIWMGIRGNEWAWQNKHWASIEHFHEVQKKWAIWGLVISFIIVPILSIILAVILSPILTQNNPELKISENEKICKHSEKILSSMLTQKTAPIETTDGLSQRLVETSLMEIITPNSVVVKPWKALNIDVRYTFFVKGKCDTAAKNCGIAVDKNGKRICRFYLGQDNLIKAE